MSRLKRKAPQWNKNQELLPSYPELLQKQLITDRGLEECLIRKEQSSKTMPLEFKELYLPQSYIKITSKIASKHHSRDAKAP